MAYIMQCIQVVNALNFEDTKLVKTKTTKRSKNTLEEENIGKKMAKIFLTWCYVTISACKKGLIG